MTNTPSAAARYLEQLPALTAPTPVLASLAGAQATDDPPSNTPTASVAGNSLVAFTAALDGTHKTALLYAMGFCQLQAVQNGGKDPKADPVGYYEYVTNMLTQIGFVTADVQFASYTATTATVELDQVVLEILGKLVTGPELALVDAAVAALQSSADAGSAPWSIYSSSSTSNNAGSFSVGMADQTTAPDGTANVTLSLGAFSFTATESSTQFLWMKYSNTSLSIQDGNTGLVLNDDLWNTPGVGDAIAGAMKAQAAGYISHLPPLKPKS